MATLLGALLKNESGGRNIPNVHQGTSSGQAQGYFQITTGTWDEFGGRKYAPDPLHATYEQQADIASKIPLRRWDESTVELMRGTGRPIDRNRTLGENLAAAGESFGSGPEGADAQPKGFYDPRRDTPSPARPKGADVVKYAEEHPVGSEGDVVTRSPYALPLPGTGDNPLVVRNQDNPFAKAGAAVAKAGQAGDYSTQVQNVPNPQAPPMPTMPTIDPSSANRNALIAALMKLNSGQLWPMGGGGGQIA